MCIVAVQHGLKEAAAAGWGELQEQATDDTFDKFMDQKLLKRRPLACHWVISLTGDEAVDKDMVN